MIIFFFDWCNCIYLTPSLYMGLWFKRHRGLKVDKLLNKYPQPNKGLYFELLLWSPEGSTSIFLNKRQFSTLKIPSYWSYLIRFLFRGMAVARVDRLCIKSGWNNVHPHSPECRPDSGTDSQEWSWLPERRTDSSMMTSHPGTVLFVSIVTPWPWRSTFLNFRRWKRLFGIVSCVSLSRPAKKFTKHQWFAMIPNKFCVNTIKLKLITIT